MVGSCGEHSDTYDVKNIDDLLSSWYSKVPPVLREVDSEVEFHNPSFPRIHCLVRVEGFGVMFAFIMFVILESSPI